MHKISYLISCSMCTTPCPHIYLTEHNAPVMVGSITCSGCRYYDKNNKGTEQYILCNHPSNKPAQKPPEAHAVPKPSMNELFDPYKE